MAIAYRAGAWSGIQILFGIAAATTFGVLARYLARCLNQPAASVVFLLGIACVSSSLLARPHLLALVALTQWTVSLVTARERGSAPSPLLLPLMVIWANLHASFILGLALTVPIALEAIVEAKSERRQAVRRWGLFLGAAIAASLLTPNGWQGLTFPFQLMHLASAASISEWSPTNFQTLQPLEGALVALIYVAFSRDVRVPFWRLIILLGLLHLALAHSRHQMLAGVVGAILLARPLAHALSDGASEASSRQSSLRWALGGLACVTLLTAIRLAHPFQRTDDPASPIMALDHVPVDIQREPVFNSYEFGGYLIFKGVKPFIDGRADMYGDDFISAYLDASRPNRVAFERIVKRYDIHWVILAARSPVVDMIDALPQWRRLYADRIAVVYVYRSDATAAADAAGAGKAKHRDPT
ncbi:hypothetical protein [Trinickia fusca]|nr:hypothetical protein [Trinickia fusca]